MSDIFRCRICANETNNRPFVITEMMLGMKDKFTYFQCSKCNCLQIASIPENIALFYPEKKYYSYNLSARKDSSQIISFLKQKINRASIFPKSLLDRTLRFLFSNRNINFLNEIIKGENIRILDVGCGDGLKFLYPIYESGFKNILGCDPFIEKEIVYDNGLSIQKKEMKNVGGEWDIISMNHSFEHIYNPKATLKSAFEMLMPDGVCIIRIPIVSSYAWKHFGTDWFQLDAPRHYFLHSIESMNLLAQQTNFVIENVKFDSTHHQFTLSERYKQGKTLEERTYKTTAGRFVHIFEKLNNSIKARKLNRNKEGDQAIFYLRKTIA